MSVMGSAQSKPFNKFERETKKRVDKGVDKGVDKSLDAAEKGIEDAIKGEGNEESTNDNESENQNTSKSKTEDTTSEVSSDEEKEDEVPKLTWSKYDFVPGDKVIFEDNLDNEENGEFPSRWDLYKGTVEVANFGDKNVIMFRGGQPTIVPYLKDSQNDYLPEVFTIELDAYVSNNTFDLYLYDRKNQRPGPGNEKRLQVHYKKMVLFQASSFHPSKELKENRWVHVSISYTNGKMKAYMDDTRLINIPHLDFNPMGLSIHSSYASDEKPLYIQYF